MEKHIFLDARLYNRSGIGRYIEGLYKGILENIPDIRVTAAGDINFLKETFLKNQDIIPYRSPIYSLQEQIEGSLLIKRFRKGVDVFHFPHYNVPWFLPKNTVVTIHDMIQFIFPDFFGRLKRFGGAFIMRNALKGAGRIIVGSECTAKDLAHHDPDLKDKVRIVQYGIAKYFTPLPEDEVASFKKIQGIEDYILYVGNRKPHKNIKRLLEAFSVIKRKHGTLQLIIVGEKFSEVNPVEVWKEHPGLNGDSIKEVIHASDDGLRQYYCGAKALVHPSLYEGFGLPPLEAMACGCPVVVSNVASLPEVCGDAAYYVNPYDVESIADGIHKVLTDEALRQSLIKKGLERAKLFSWEKSAKEHIKIFEEVLSS
jgi:glycosyltransferase involved in cell wall biosynthesis